MTKSKHLSTSLKKAPFQLKCNKCRRKLSKKFFPSSERSKVKSTCFECKNIDIYDYCTYNNKYEFNRKMDRIFTNCQQTSLDRKTNEFRMNLISSNETALSKDALVEVLKFIPEYACIFTQDVYRKVNVRHVPFNISYSNPLGVCYYRTRTSSEYIQITKYSFGN